MYKRALIVDDNTGTINLLRAVAKIQNIEPEFFTDPRKALDYFREHMDEIGVVVSDIDMPYLNGVDLFWEVLNLDPSTLFVFMTANDGGEHSERHELLRPLFEHPNVVGVYEKPFKRVSEFVAMVERVCYGVSLCSSTSSIGS